MIRILVLIAVVYAALALGLTVFQRSLFYPAPAYSAGVPAGFEPVSYTTHDRVDLSAGYRQAVQGMPTIVYFHGNGADWQSSVVATDRLVPAGFGVLAAEYRGYGGNPGMPSEEGLYRDGRAAIAWLAERGVGASELAIIGNSIGTGVAVQMALETRPAALVLISPFNSLQQLVGERVPWLPTSWMLKDFYRSDTKLPEITAPILILHGDADAVVPVAHARQLAATQPDATLEIFPGAGHDLAWRDPAEKRTLTFLLEVFAP